MTFLEWTSLASVVLLGAMSPGPSLAVVVSNTLRLGAGAGVAAGLAHGAGVALYAVAVVSGLAVLITTSPTLFTAIQWAGAAYLAWLGLQSLRSSGGTLTEARNSRLQSPAVQGFSVAFLNPKLAIFFLALFSQFLDVDATLTTKLVMVLTMGAIDASWYCGVSLLLAQPAILPRLRRAEPVINRLFGLILIALAIRIVWTFD
jgi:threonine/homoserine/homoserine lactone efflux protein